MTDIPPPPNAPGAGGVSDELLMAYADGELPPHERRLVRAALSTHPALVERLESFLYTRGSFRQVYDEILDAPIPDRLLDTVLGPGGRAAQAAESSFLDLARARIAELAGRFGMPLAAVAASVLIIAGWQLNEALRVDPFVPDAHRLDASAAMQRVLEATPMGVSVRIEGSVDVKPTLTFMSHEHGWCRQYELALSRSLQSFGMACRGDDGLWHTHVVSPAVGSKPAPKPGSANIQYQSARGPGALIDAARQHIKASDVLGPKDEAHKIKQGWTKN